MDRDDCLFADGFSRDLSSNNTKPGSRRAKRHGDELRAPVHGDLGFRLEGRAGPTSPMRENPPSLLRRPNSLLMRPNGSSWSTAISGTRPCPPISYRTPALALLMSYLAP